MTNEGMLCALENGNKVILITIDEWKVQFFRSYLLSVCFLTYNYFLQGMGDKLINDASLKGNLCKTFSSQAIKYTTVKRNTQIIEDHQVSIFACCQPKSILDVLAKDKDPQGLYDR